MKSLFLFLIWPCFFGQGQSIPTSPPQQHIQTPDPRKSPENALSRQSFDCLCRITQAESFFESRPGQIEVAKNVLKRAQEQKKTICQVVKDKKQYNGYGTARYRGSIQPSVQASVQLAVNKFNAGDKSYYFFYNPDKATCRWMIEKGRGAKDKKRVGHHVFFNLPETKGK